MLAAGCGYNLFILVVAAGCGYNLFILVLAAGCAMEVRGRRVVHV